MPKAQYVHKTTKRHKKRCSAERFWEKVVVGDPDFCWEWQASIRGGFGYGQFSFNGYPEYAHRVSWILTNGDIPENMQVCHKCDNPLCVNPHHLFLGTQQDNMTDMLAKSRDALIGERNPAAKLTEEVVKEAFLLRGQGKSFRKIAIKLGVSRWTITDALTGKTWKHIEGKP